PSRIAGVWVLMKLVDGQSVFTCLKDQEPQEWEVLERGGIFTNLRHKKSRVVLRRSTQLVEAALDRLNFDVSGMFYALTAEDAKKKAEKLYLPLTKRYGSRL